MLGIRVGESDIFVIRLGPVLSMIGVVHNTFEPSPFSLALCLCLHQSLRLSQKSPCPYFCLHQSPCLYFCHHQSPCLYFCLHQPCLYFCLHQSPCLYFCLHQSPCLCIEVRREWILLLPVSPIGHINTRPFLPAHSC